MSTRRPFRTATMLPKNSSYYPRPRYDNRCVKLPNLLRALTNLSNRKFVFPLISRLREVPCDRIVHLQGITARHRKDDSIRSIYKWIPTYTSVWSENFPHRLARFPVTACACNATQKINRQTSRARGKVASTIRFTNVSNER